VRETQQREFEVPGLAELEQAPQRGFVARQFAEACGFADVTRQRDMNAPGANP